MPLQEDGSSPKARGASPRCGPVTGQDGIPAGTGSTGSGVPLMGLPPAWAAPLTPPCDSCD